MGNHGNELAWSSKRLVSVLTRTQQLCHLLEARAEFGQRGLYDSMCEGTLEYKTKIVREAVAFDFQLHSYPCYSKNQQLLTLPPIESHDLPNWGEDWVDRLYRKGVAKEDLEFLVEILHPDPAQRWTAGEIAQCGYLDF